MKAINKDDTIANQYKKIWNNFHEIKRITNKDISVSIKKSRTPKR